MAKRAIITTIFEIDPLENDKVRLINDGQVYSIVENDDDVIRADLEDLMVNELSFGEVSVTIEDE